jgi:hypothetical protein
VLTVDYHLPKYEDSKINPEFLRANSNFGKCTTLSATVREWYENILEFWKKKHSSG